MFFFGSSIGDGINVPIHIQVLFDKYKHTHAVFVIGKSGHVNMVLVVCGFSFQYKYATTVVLGVFLSALVVLVLVVLIKCCFITFRSYAEIAEGFFFVDS